MIVLLDDIKLRTAEEFLPYINAELGSGEVNDLEQLSLFLDTADEEIEFLVSDYDEIGDGEKTFAARVMNVLWEAKRKNPNIRITMM